MAESPATVSRRPFEGLIRDFSSARSSPHALAARARRSTQEGYRAAATVLSRRGSLAARHAPSSLAHAHIRRTLRMSSLALQTAWSARGGLTREIVDRLTSGAEN